MAILGIVAATFAAYANSFGNEFLFDDISQIVENTVIRSFANIPKAFTHHLTYFSEEHQEAGKFYRPLQTLTLMSDYLLWGKEPLGYHITNTLLHALVSSLLFIFFYLITRNAVMSFLAGLIYAVHPVHTEAVAYMSGRADSLCAIFLLIMVIFQIAYWRSTRTAGKVFCYAIIFGAFMLALISKEFSVVFPFLMMICELCLRGDGYSPPKRKQLIFYLPLFLIMGVWFFAKNAVVSTETMVTQPASLATRLATLPRLLLDYVRLSFIPASLHMEYKLPFPKSIFQKGYFEGAVFFCIFAGIFYYAWRRGKREGAWRIIFFGLTWFIVGLIPYFNIIFQLNAPFAEHWLYIPEMGLILAVISWLFYCAKNNAWMKRTAVTGCIVTAIIYSIITMHQNLVWKSPLEFYIYTLKYAPYSATTHNNLAVEYIKQKDLLRAEKLLERALELDPDYTLAKNNLAALKMEIKHKGLRRE